MKQVVAILITACVFAGIGYVIGKGALFNRLLTSEKIFKPQEIRLSGYKYINPLLECEFQPELGVNEYASLEDKLTNYVDDKKSNGSATEIAVYFRDLNNGPWVGVNERVDFAPASLLKVPVMMAYFKQAESSPGLLDKKIKFDTDFLVRKPVFQAQHPLEVGKEYSVLELITQMIAESDNVALRLLEQNIPNELIDKITLDLGIETPTKGTPEDFMSVRSYASLFRILYNASYLNKESSEKSLNVLTKSTFGYGLVAGTPSHVVIAHKFGERELSNGVNQLHDCGIVYYPKKPYLLCVMTRGVNVNTLAQTISEVAKITYEEVDLRNKQ